MNNTPYEQKLLQRINILESQLNELVEERQQNIKKRKQYYQNPNVKERNRKNAKEYYQRNKEKILQKAREKYSLDKLLKNNNNKQ